MDRADTFDAFARCLGARANRRRLIVAGAGAFVALGLTMPGAMATAARRRRHAHCPHERVCGNRCCAAGKWCGNPLQSVCVGPDNPVSMQ